VESLIRSSRLARAAANGAWKSSGSLLTSAAQLGAVHCASTSACALDEVDCTAARLAREGDTCYLRIARTRPIFRYASVVYGNVRRNTGYRASSIPTILQYWFFYPVNWWRSTPTQPVAEQIHEGDWESVTIGLDRRGSPVFAGYSQHERGRWAPWADVRRRGTHPLVYVARGSHSNQFTPGRHRIPVPFAGNSVAALAAAVKPLLRDYTCNRRQLTYGPNGLASKPTAVVRFSPTTDWARFRGAWGKGDFIFLPRAKAFFPAGGSPPGPVQRASWHDPVGVILRTWSKGERALIDPAYCPGAPRS
jgi:hypothetical protein